MNFEQLSEEEKKEVTKLMFAPLTNAQEVKDWVRTFLDLELPLEITDPDSNSSPLECIWQIYNTFKTNTGNINPGYILMSCREGMKTVSVAILETLLLIHFKLEIGHAAATETQSAVGLGYIDSFIRRLEPMMTYAGWIPLTSNKRIFKFQTPGNDPKTPFIKIVICTAKGMNSLHANVLFLDELDLADPGALKEGKYITSYSKGIYGVKVYLSTRKYAFGNMSQAMDKADEMNYKILNWNILDVTERCPTERHLPEGPKVDMYVNKNLPLQKLTPDEFAAIPTVEQVKFDLLKNVHEGCSKCPLLPVCKGRLANKPDTATGGFYKPISSVIQSFLENDPDSAEAQLMCWKPGSTGLVYPRFNKKKGNVVSIKEAYEIMFGPTTSAITELTMLDAMQKAGILFYAGVDWGYTHPFVIAIVAVIPNGDIWLMETYSAPGLEFEDMLEIAKTYRDKYRVHKWFVDQAMPSNIKSFRKNGMPCPKFVKDVMGGIEAMRSKIMNASGARKFKAINNDMNQKAISALEKHRFVLDPQGNVTLTPDDAPGIADICDALRYIGQNLFPVRGTKKVESTWLENRITSLNMNDPEARRQAEVASQHENQMKAEIAKIIGQNGTTGGSGKKGGFFFSF